MPDRYLDVAVEVPFPDERVYTYRLQSDFPFELPYGAKVYVPFGRRFVDGFVVGKRESPPGISESVIKDIDSLYDLRFLPSPSDLLLARVLAERLGACLSAVFSLFWPPFIKRYSVKNVIENWASGARESFIPMGFPRSGGEMDGGGHIHREVCLFSGSFNRRWTYYSELVRETLSRARGVLMLVPEIKKIQRVLPYLEPFKDELVLVHSDLTGSIRRESWYKLSSGQKHLALGTRSAVFAPVRDLDLIIVDEEESTSYKAEDYPRYNARNVAMLRAPFVTLGSSHPSVWTYHQVSTGRIKMVSSQRLNSGSACTEFRHGSRPKVTVQIVDLLKTRSSDVISPEMISSLSQVFSRGGKALLFLPRRGQASLVFCQDCGNILKCPRCSLPLSYHAQEKEMVCHTCGYREPPPDLCPSCGGYRWKFSGPGIQKAQLELEKKFPSVRVYRFDNDVLRSVAGEKIIGEFKMPGPACLLATQAVLGFTGMPEIAMVGVISPDVLFNLPSYRACENVFLTLMSLMDFLEGSEEPETVTSDEKNITVTSPEDKIFMVQTRNPKNHGISGLLSPADFYEKELEERSALNYPPFGYFVKIDCYGSREDKVKSYLNRMAQEFEAAIENENLDITVLGPSPAPKVKVRGKYHWNLALKGQDLNSIIRVYREALKKGGWSNLSLVLDSEDPVT